MYYSSHLISMEYLRNAMTQNFYAFVYFLQTYNEILEDKACLGFLNLIAYSQKTRYFGKDDGQTQFKTMPKRGGE